MTGKVKSRLRVAILATALSCNAFAGDVEDGNAAYDRGDFATAHAKYTIAANQGDSSAQNTLGLMYDQGQGVAQDYEQAAIWYRKAAEQGHSRAQYNLAVKYQFGQGVPVNFKQSVYWFMMAAEQGNASSQHSLGVLYAEGRGVQRDLVQAYVWTSLAAAQGHDGGRTNLEIFERFMTPEQVVEAQRLTQEWATDSDSRI